jgi:hypothetical protein
VATPDGHSNGTLHVPDGDGPRPGVLVFPDASGARETIRQMANRLAGIGYVALIPDSYHRAGQRAPFDVATLFTDEPLLLLGARKPTTTGRTLPACPRTRTCTTPAESRTGNQPPQTRQPRERAHLYGIGSSPLSGEAASPGNGDGQRPNIGHIRLLQGIKSDYRRSDGHEHLRTSRYFS